MHCFLQIIAFVFFLFTGFYIHLYWKLKKYPKGPFPCPFLGNLPQMDKTNPHKTIARWGEEYGGLYTMWFGPKPYVVITDYQLMKEKLIKEGYAYAGRETNFVLKHCTQGELGLIHSQGERWREQRRFSMQILRDLGFGKSTMEDKINAETDKLISHIGKLLGNKDAAVINPRYPIEFCTANVISSTIFGTTFKVGDPNFVLLKHLITEQFNLVTKPDMLFLSMYPWLKIFFSKTFNKLTKNRDKILDFLRNQVDIHKQTYFQSKSQPTDFTGAYLKEMNERMNSPEKNPGYFGENQFLTVLGDLWAAGMETLTTTLLWGILFMVHHPEAQEKARKEIFEHRKNGNKKIGLADKVHLPYTVATIHEIQRVGNINHINSLHRTMEDVNLRGFLIKKGTVILPQIAAVHVNPELFPEPEMFRPERHLGRKPEALVPFSMGKRACVGESLARMELFLVFTALIENFKFSPDPNEKELPSLDGICGQICAPKPYTVLVEKIQNCY